MSYRPVWIVEERNNIDGIPCKAPFVLMPNRDPHNAGDIPEQFWTEATDRAIRRAFELGWIAARMQLAEALDVARGGAA